MKPLVRGKHIYFREIDDSDATFVVSLRTHPMKNKYISCTSSDVEKQLDFIRHYQQSCTDFYFIICTYDSTPIGTIRIYDIRGESFCWGSWILSDEAPTSAAVESALLIYDFAFFTLHYQHAHFDVRKQNVKVVDFHKRFGATIVRETDNDYYFSYEKTAYTAIRKKYARYIR